MRDHSGPSCLNAAAKVIGCAIVMATALLAQSFLGSITGSVTDKTGALVPNAQVVATETSTALQRAAVTNPNGSYLFSDLPPGSYLITISAAGFKNLRSSEIVLTAQQTQRFDARLEIGASTERVDVQAVSSTLNTENAEIDGILATKELLNLPANERSTFSFLDLNSFNVQGGDGSSYSIGGLRGEYTNFTIDGVTSNSGLYGGQSGPQTEESFEAVSEVKLMASNNSAEFTNVATVIVSSRSGTNQFHGTAFYDQENNALDARSFFSTTKPWGPIRHEFGASAGGPIVLPKIYNGHNKTFFHFTWEQQSYPGVYSSTANVPTAAMRQGDFSSLLSQGIVVTDPTTGNPFSGNQIPSTRLSQVALKTQSLLFLPANTGPADNYTNNWVGLFPSSSRNNRYVTRLDHIVSEHDTLSGRISIRNLPEPQDQGGPFPGNDYSQTRRTWNGYISETHIFTPSLLNEFRLGYSRDAIRSVSFHSGSQVVQEIGLQGVNTNTTLSGIPSFNFGNFSSLTEATNGLRTSQTKELLDNVTLATSRHNIKAGILIRDNTPNQDSSPSNGTDFGSFNFTGFASGFDYADFLLGIPQQSSLSYRAPNAYLHYIATGLFVQDDFRVTPKLTLNFGLRWEYNQPPVDQNNLRFSFNPLNGNIVVPTAAQLSKVSPYFPANIPIETASQAGFPSRSLLRANWHDFAPRFSFAYRPFSEGTFVVRGGYGIFYAPLISVPVQGFIGGPFASTVNYTNALTNGVAAFAFPDPFGGSSSLPSESISPQSPNLRTPYVQQWNLTLERQLPGKIVTRASYRGFRTVEIPYQRDLNMPPASSNPPNQNLFYYPNFYQINYVEDGGIQKMNALDLAIERKLTNGVTFQSQYTWAKNLSDAGDDYEVNTAGLNTLDPYNRSLDMGNVSYNPRHRWVTSGLYELPFGRGKRFASNVGPGLNRLAGGWQLTSIFAVPTGQFLTPVDSSIDPTNNRSINTGQVRPDCLSNPNLPNPTPTNWFNLAAFAVPANGSYGTCGRGIITGPGIVNLDIGILKDIQISERAKIQIRATATDALNHPLFSVPGGNFPYVEVLDSTNGNAVGSVLGHLANRGSFGAGNRIIEVGARFEF
jgi:Carboxypeptidase regulatory-like domain